LCNLPIYLFIYLLLNT